MVELSERKSEEDSMYDDLLGSFKIYRSKSCLDLEILRLFEIFGDYMEKRGNMSASRNSMYFRLSY